MDSDRVGKPDQQARQLPTCELLKTDKDKLKTDRDKQPRTGSGRSTPADRTYTRRPGRRACFAVNKHDPGKAAAVVRPRGQPEAAHKSLVKDSAAAIVDSTRTDQPDQKAGAIYSRATLDRLRRAAKGRGMQANRT